MKRIIRYFSIVVLVAGGSLAASGKVVNSIWKDDAAGFWSGSFTDTAHWKNGIVPDNHDGDAYFAQYDGAFTGTVFYPDGVFTNAAGCRINYVNGMDLTLDGSNTELFKMNGPYGQYPIRFSLNGTWFAIPTDHSGSGSGTDRGIWATMSNFLVHTTCSADALKIDVKKGYFEFMRSCGKLFSNTQKRDITRGEVILGPGVTYKAPMLSLNNKTFPTNVLAVNGANVLIDSGNPNDDDVFYQYAEGVVPSVGMSFITNGATLSVTGGLFITASTVGSDSMMHIEDSRLEYTGSLGLYGWASFKMLRAALSNDFATASKITFGDESASKTATVHIADSDVYHRRQIHMNFADVCVTNSSVHQTGDSDVGAFHFQCGANVSLIDSDWTCSAIEGGKKGVKGHSSLLRAVRSKISSALGNSYLGRTYDSSLELIDSSLRTASFYLGGEKATSATSHSSSASGRMYLYGNSKYSAGMHLWLGSATGGGGEVYIAGNSVFNSSSSTFAIGKFGHGKVVVCDNGSFVSPIDIALAAEESSDDALSELIQTGGAIKAKIIRVAVASGRRAAVSLLGGKVFAQKIVGGAGSSSLVADGVTFVPSTETQSLVSDLGEAFLGAKGLTVDSEYDVGVPQLFADKPGAEGRGRLVLSGSGEKTLSMSSGAPSVVELTSGSLAFAPGAAMPRTLIVTNGAAVTITGAVTLANLVVGSEDSIGVLRIDPTTRITVTGELDVGNMHLELIGGFESEESYEIFLCPNGVSADSAENVFKSFVRSGLQSGTSCSFKSVSGEGGALTLRLDVAEGDTISVDVDEGNEAHTTNILYHSSQRLVADVAKDASLTLSGRLGYGRFEKVGEGTLYLTGLENIFYPGLLLSAGVLSISDSRQLGNDNINVISAPRLAGGKLEVTGDDLVEFASAPVLDAPEADSLIEIDAKTDVTMPMPEVARGAFRKRGAGTLTFNASVNGASYAYSTKASPKLLKDMSKYTGFTVQEGEMVFRGTRPGITNSITCNLDVGVPGEARAPGKVQPGLVVDNVYLKLTNSDRILALGSYILNDATNAYNGSVLAEANSFVTDPYLVVTNGAVLHAGWLRVLYGDELNRNRLLLGSGYITVDNGTVISENSYSPSNVTGDPDLSCVGSRGCFAFHEYKNASTLLTREVVVNGTCSVRFEDSLLASFTGNNSKSPTKINHTVNDATSRWEFVRSEFCVATITRDLKGYQCRYGQDYVFEDTLWSCGNKDLSVGATNVNMNIYVRGRGLRFAPYEGRTYTVIRKIRGTGGIVMEGPGTLRFARSRYLDKEQSDPVDINPDPAVDLTVDTGTKLYNPCTVMYSGATEINAGTVDFGGFSLTNMTLTGAGGTVKNAQFVRATLANTNLVFASDVSFDVNTKFDFGAFDAEAGDEFLVGRYEGVAPDVASWRGRNFAAKGLKARFSAQDGVISATVEPVGLQIIVR